MATEFHYHESSKCKIQAEFWTEDELMSQLVDMLQSYRQYQLDFDSLDPIEKNDCEERYFLATDTFSSMFRGRLDDWDFLTADAEDDILETFRGWISELRPHQSNADDNLSLNACSDRLASLASDTASDDAAPVWPYLRKIKYVFL